MRPSRIGLSICFLSFVVSGNAGAQCEPRWSEQFGTFELDGVVHATAVFDDGDGPALYIGGEFSGVDDRIAINIARWRAGTGWGAVSSGITGQASGGGSDARVHALATLDDGSGPALYAAGEFTHAGGTPCAGIARWRDGQWTPLGTGLSGALDDVRAHSLCAHDDGSGPALYVGGNFTGAGGVTARKIARWNGTSWSAVGGGIDGPQGHSVYALASYAGQLYAGGEFPGAVGVSAPSLVRWNGTSWGVAGGGANGIVYALEVFDDGGGAQLYAGGTFSLLGVPAPRIARWNGSSWSAPASGPNNTVLAFEVVDAGAGADLCVAGIFTGTSSGVTGSVVRWNGGAWASLAGGPTFDVHALTALTDEEGARLVAGGTPSYLSSAGLSAWNGSQWRRVTRRVGGFGFDTSFLDRYVEALQAIDHGGALGRWLYVGGELLNGAHETPSTRHLARFDGEHWSSVGDVTAGPSVTDVGVRDFATYDDGSGEKLVVAGRFDAIGAFPARSIALYDGAAWTALGDGLSIFNQPAAVHRVAVYGGGTQLFAIGAIDEAGTTPVNDIARWNGASWSDVSFSSENVLLYALIAFDDGSGEKLYVGGYMPNGSPEEWLVLRWDGASWTDVGTGMIAHDTPYAFGTFDDGSGTKLYAAAQSGRVYVWNGSAWSVAIPQIGGSVYALHSHDDGSGSALYFAGGFDGPGATMDNLARWDGTTLSTAGGNPDETAFALASFDWGSGPNLFVGGPFNRIFSIADGTVDAHAIARFGSPCPPPGEPFCSGDGSATSCPCGNAGASGHGCANSFDANGARLVASGVPLVSADTLRLDATAVSNSVVTFMQGTLEQNGGLGTVFGDGLRCAGGSIIRLGSVLAASNVATYPSSGQLPISERGQIPVLGNVTRTYQVWYRNSVTFCTPSTFNLTNGVRTFWAP